MTNDEKKPRSEALVASNEPSGTIAPAPAPVSPRFLHALQVVVTEGAKKAREHVDRIVFVRHALELYGRHRQGCPAEENDAAPCVCGWTQVKKRLQIS